MADKPRVLAYFLRHGVTEMSPKSEGWSQIPLNDLGKTQAMSAGNFINSLEVKPTWAVSSDLERAIQTCEIASKILKLKIVKPLSDLRAFGHDEDPKKFEERNDKAFSAILEIAKKNNSVPLIVCHRSNSAWLGKKFSGVLQHLDYRENTLVYEGGVVVIDTNAARPIYRSSSENPRANLMPFDGTAVAGFVTVEDNKPPRECGNCKWMDKDHCDNLVVTADDELGIRYGKKRNEKGKWIVLPSDCCNSFQSKKIVVEGLK